MPTVPLALSFTTLLAVRALGASLAVTLDAVVVGLARAAVAADRVGAGSIHVAVVRAIHAFILVLRAIRLHVARVALTVVLVLAHI